MKNVLRSSIMLALTALVFIASPVQAQDDDPKIEAQQLTDLMKAELRLTRDQTLKVFEANQQAVRKINQVLTQKTDTAAAFTTSIEKVIDDMDVALLEILNGDQWNRWLNFSITIIDQLKANTRDKLQRSGKNAGKNW